jgi:hypothetical protein
VLTSTSHKGLRVRDHTVTHRHPPGRTDVVIPVRALLDDLPWS